MVVQVLSILPVVVKHVRVVMVLLLVRERDRRDDDLSRAGSRRHGRRGGAEAGGRRRREEGLGRGDGTRLGLLFGERARVEIGGSKFQHVGRVDGASCAVC